MKDLIRLGILISTFLSLPLFFGEARTADWEELFYRANQSYREGRFQEAADRYTHLINAGYESGDIHYNLGNAYFRLERIGWAILSYERARLMIPRDADLNFNLRQARDQTRDAIAEPRSFMDMALFWIDSLSLYELFWGFCILNVLFWGLLLLRLFRRSEWTYYTSLVLMVFWMLAAASFGSKWYQVESDDRAVILKQEVSVLAGPDTGDTVLFKLHEGTVVHSERLEDGWSLIRLSDGKRGWMGTSALASIRVKQPPPSRPFRQAPPDSDN